jgi:hypothetical protein
MPKHIDFHFKVPRYGDPCNILMKISRDTDVKTVEVGSKEIGSDFGIYDCITGWNNGKNCYFIFPKHYTEEVLKKIIKAEKDQKWIGVAETQASLMNVDFYFEGRLMRRTREFVEKRENPSYKVSQYDGDK